MFKHGKRFLINKKIILMDEKDFEDWCSLKHSKLKQYRITNFILDIAMFIFLALMYILAGGLNFIAVEILGYSKTIGGTYALFGVFLSFVLFFVIMKLLNLPMNKVEFISCMLNKISKEIELDDIKELKKDLKIFKKHSNFKIKFPHRSLFKKENELQKEFFKSLKILPEIINYYLINNQLKEMDIDIIKKLAFYIFTDDSEKTKILDDIIKNNPKTEDLKSFTSIIDFRKYLEKNLVKIILIFIILCVIFYYFVYHYLGIDKNTTFIGFITLFGVITYIIYKK